MSHLLPTGEPFRLGANKALTKVLKGLAASGDDVRADADLGYLDLFPDSTRELEEWERQFGLNPAADASEADRRLLLAAEWRSTGGQSAAYIQGVLQTAGFNVFVHEWWASADPYVPRDPRDYVPSYSIGTVQCGAAVAICGNPRARCNGFTTTDPKYWSTLTLSRNAPPPIPSDSARWPYFLYIGGETFPDEAIVELSRKSEFQRLIQKLKPSQQWVVTLVIYDAFIATEGGDLLQTEEGEFLTI